jgi:AGCS family alanine or glycine:cation symporter
MVQANSIAGAMEDWLSVDPLYVGIALAVLTGIALFGGIKSIGKVSSWLVPAMAGFYVLGGLAVILMNCGSLMGVFGEIFRQAFQGKAAVGGFAGSTIMMAVQYGVSRSVFSTEAGLGSSPIAAAAAKTDVPGRQALISMSGVFITSIVVCTITGLCIGVSGLLGQTGAGGEPLNGSALAVHAFQSAFPGGAWVVAISVILFGYTTVLGWAYYGEKCMEYLFGGNVVRLYRILFTLVLIPGAVMSLQTVWSFANIMNGLMAFPNLIGLFGLSSIVIAEARSFEELLKFERKRAEKAPLRL